MVFNAVQIMSMKRGRDGSREGRMPFKVGKHNTSAWVNIMSFLWLGGGKRSPEGQGFSRKTLKEKLPVIHLLNSGIGFG